MKSNLGIKSIFICALLILPSLLSGAENSGSLKARVILRLGAYAPPAIEGTRKCPICAAQLPVATVEENGVKIFNELLDSKIGGITSCKFIAPEGQTRMTFALDSEEDRQKLKSEAAGLGADAVFYPVLLRYRERVGNKFAASQPAAVAFHLYLLDAKTLQTIWHDRYSEEQQALSENVLQAKNILKRKIQWVTADRLLQDGLDKVFKGFPACGGGAQ